MNLADQYVRDQLDAHGFVPGARIRFDYHKPMFPVQEYSGEIMRIRLPSEVVTSTTVKDDSLYLVILKTDNGVRSFWEARMENIKIVDES